MEKILLGKIISSEVADNRYQNAWSSCQMCKIHQSGQNLGESTCVCLEHRQDSRQGQWSFVRGGAPPEPRWTVDYFSFYSPPFPPHFFLPTLALQWAENFCATDVKHIVQESMILEAGYEAEAHKVVTDDDYILTVYRWLLRAHTNSYTMYRIVGKGPVIFLQHGMVGSSTAWYLLAKRTWYWEKVSQDAGRCSTRRSSLSPRRAGLWCLVGQLQREPWEQVPLDSRSDLGVSSLREHKTLDPDNDDEYWQFAQDEMSKYDLPSQLNYVLQITNKKKGVVWIFHKYIKSFPTDFLYGPFYGHNDVHGDELNGPHLGRQGRAGRLPGACGFCCTHEESCKGKRKHCHLKIWKFINTQASVNYAKDWLGQLFPILGRPSQLAELYHSEFNPELFSQGAYVYFF